MTAPCVAVRKRCSLTNFIRIAESIAFSISALSKQKRGIQDQPFWFQAADAIDDVGVGETQR
ncbi:MAG: hypothetical protein ABIP99_18265 [Ilumatobacteraceae bacterium]